MRELGVWQHYNDGVGVPLENMHAATIVIRYVKKYYGKHFKQQTVWPKLHPRRKCVLSGAV
jgi:hypothetical protein